MSGGVSVWDKEKKEARNKPTCIGKLDPLTQEIISSKRCSESSPKLPTVYDDQPETPSPLVVSAMMAGALLVLDEIDQRIGLGKTLSACFPEHPQHIKLMAYYWAMQGNALYCCEGWSKLVGTGVD